MHRTFATVDQRLVVWYYPNVVYVDKDLTAATKFVKDGGFGKVPQLTYFNGEEEARLVMCTICMHHFMVLQTKPNYQMKLLIGEARGVGQDAAAYVLQRKGEGQPPQGLGILLKSYGLVFGCPLETADLSTKYYGVRGGVP